MDATRFDDLVASLCGLGTRRGLLRLMVGLPLLGVLATAPGAANETAAAGRRQRRKKRHKHMEGKNKEQRKGKRKGDPPGRGGKQCKPEPRAATCEGMCGSVRNNCKKAIDCGPCDCDPPCPACSRCDADRTCRTCDTCCHDVCCTGQSPVCHADTGECCVPPTRAQTCEGACGDVTNTCGQIENCGSCACAGTCPTCQVCDRESGACTNDPDQVGDDCGGTGQVCQPNGACACSTAPDSCPSCMECGGDGTCHGCPDCCDGGACVASCGQGRICCAGQCRDGDCCGDGACGAHAHCASHTCQCDASFHACQGACVSDRETDHCGTACSPCPSSLCSPATCDGQHCGRDPIANCCTSDDECGDGDPCSTDTCDLTTHTCVHSDAPPTTACGGDGACCGGICCSAPAHATPICDAGTCGFACAAGFHRCGGQCVSDTDIATCGASCAPCPTIPQSQATCDGTSCGIQCDASHDFCGGECVARGDESNCTGVCDTCGPHMHCAQSGCVCDAGFADCDGNPATGCETDLNSDATCGACTIQCAADQHCVNGSCLCDPATCNGCCQGAACIPLAGQTTTACGRNGAICGACADNMVCSTGVCTGFGCDCAAMNNCSGHGICTDTCACVCDEPYFGAACTELPLMHCTDFTTCSDCRAHLTDGCTWCDQAVDGASDVCVDAIQCFIPAEFCPAP